MERFLQATRGAPEHPSLRKALNLWKAPPEPRLTWAAAQDATAWRCCAMAGAWSHSISPAPRSMHCEHRWTPVHTSSPRFASHSRTVLPFPPSSWLMPVSLYRSANRRHSRVSGRASWSACAGWPVQRSLFGLRDSWAGRNLTCHRYEQLLELFEDWELLELNEIEFDGKTATGQDKHWHLFEAIARRS